MQTRQLQTFFLSLTFFITASGQQLHDSMVLAKITAASKTNPLISKTITYLADIYGPRLLGTSNYYQAAGWAKKELTTLGADTAWFESFDQQHRGWSVRSLRVPRLM